ncbi:hypothetical protein HELRODRAFT_191722 [Helobdella robusta]|uniref:Palmitoyltransferase n=1 Tax=Helobdella robusta TaxID=6412 RepID=T1FT83_HELRO|nr:hypothetical protein HELRODRAFT_191722 [Helobdella robusta]ESO04776.1 hypothetical protein HELRODRAFT_191722 [Helobdella robusta]
MMELPFYALILSFIIHLQKKGFRRLISWGPLIALSLISFIVTCMVKCHLAWWPPESFWPCASMVVIMIELNIILYNFFQSSFLGPGLVEIGWKPKHLEEKIFLQYCNICLSYKVPRSHHCRKCQRCVMKMDHHCPWINNCVGHKNHANFFFFLFITPIACLHAIAILVPSTYRCFYRNYYYFYGTMNDIIVDLSSVWFIFSMMAVGMAVGVVISVGSLFVIQLKVILKNETGIETWIREKANYRKREKGEGDFIYPYNLGRWNNLLMTLNIGNWGKMDGVWWPVREDCHQYTLTVEQIQQKCEKRTRSVLFVVHRKYSGSYLPVTFGCRTCYCQPCFDEPRLKVKEGERVLVTRLRRNWLYGEKLFLSEVSHVQKKEKRQRGWFPRQCASRSSEKFDLPANPHHPQQLETHLHGDGDDAANGVDVDIERLNVVADEKFLNKKVL